jgi:hypothetical protein
MILKNPDPSHIYHCWHYCTVCRRTYTHSQGAWERMKRRSCCRDNLQTVPTTQDTLEIQETENAHT